MPSERLPLDAEPTLSTSTPPMRAAVLPLAGRAGFGLALAGAALLAWRGLLGFDPSRGPASTGSEVEDFLFEPSASSPLMVLGGTLWLFARRWGRVQARLGGPPQPLLAAAGLATGFALCGWAYYVGQPALLLPSLSAALLGAAAWLGGVPLVRAVALPSLFLLFAMPLPTALVNQFIYPLQLATAEAAASILSALGMPSLAEGDRIYRGGQVFQVIESCSGLRTTETLFMSAFLYHDLFFRSRLQSTLVVLGSIPLALLVNQLRVLTIVLNPYSNFAAVHTAQGLAMIVLGVLLIAAYDGLLTRWLPAAPLARRRAARMAWPGPRLVGLTAAVAALGGVSLAISPWQDSFAGETQLTTLPAWLDGWRTQGLKLDKSFLGSVSFSEFVHRRYERGGDEIEVLLGSNRRVDPRVNFVSPKTAIPGSGWVVALRDKARLASGREVERLEVHSGRQRRLVYLWTYGMSSPSQEVARALFAIDRSGWRRPGRAVVARIATPIDGSTEAAEARLAVFAVPLERELDRILGADGS